MHPFKHRNTASAFTRVHWIALVLLLATTSPQTALSQVIGPRIQEPDDVPGNRIFPEYKPLGFDLAGFEILPSIDIATRFDSNVFSRTSTKRADAILQIEPNIQIHKEDQTNSLMIRLQARDHSYLTLSSQDTLEYRAEATYTRARDATHNLSMNIGHRREAVQRGTVENDLLQGAPLIRYISYGSLTGRNRLNRLSFDAQLYAAQQSFDDVKINNDRILPQKFRNLNQISVRAVATYDVSSRSALIASVEYENLNYALSPKLENRDAQNVSTTLGVKYEVNRVLYTRFGLGIRHYNFESSALGSFTGLAITGHFRYFPKRTLAIRGTIEQSSTTSPYDFVNSVTLTTAHIELEYEMLRSISWLASSRLTFEDYAKKTYSGKRFEVSTGPRLRINRAISAQATIGYVRRLVHGPAPFERYNQFYGLAAITLAR